MIVHYAVEYELCHPGFLLSKDTHLICMMGNSFSLAVTKLKTVEFVIDVMVTFFGSSVSFESPSMLIS